MIDLIMTGEHLEKFKKFQKKHIKKHGYHGAIDATCSIIFLCTSIGYGIDAKCNFCDKEISLKELE